MFKYIKQKAGRNPQVNIQLHNLEDNLNSHEYERALLNLKVLNESQLADNKDIFKLHLAALHGINYQGGEEDISRYFRFLLADKRNYTVEYVLELIQYELKNVIPTEINLLKLNQKQEQINNILQNLIAYQSNPEFIEHPVLLAYIARLYFFLFMIAFLIQCLHKEIPIENINFRKKLFEDKLDYNIGKIIQEFHIDINTTTQDYLNNSITYFDDYRKSDTILNEYAHYDVSSILISRAIKYPEFQENLLLKARKVISKYNDTIPSISKLNLEFKKQYLGSYKNTIPYTYTYLNTMVIDVDVVKDILEYYLNMYQNITHIKLGLIKCLPHCLQWLFEHLEIDPNIKLWDYLVHYLLLAKKVFLEYKDIQSEDFKEYLHSYCILVENRRLYWPKQMLYKFEEQEFLLMVFKFTSIYLLLNKVEQNEILDSKQFKHVLERLKCLDVFLKVKSNLDRLIDEPWQHLMSLPCW